MRQGREESGLNASMMRANLINAVVADVSSNPPATIQASASEMVFGSIVSSLKDVIQVSKNKEGGTTNISCGKQKFGKDFVPFVVGCSSTTLIAIAEIEDDEVTNS